MPYRNLHELIQNSRSSRAFFLSRSPEVQCALHQHNDYVHSAAQLRMRAQAVVQMQHLSSLGRWDTPAR